ncbi:acyl transferase/acyl hydrolase/lysophospholipase [Chaetomium sp. MPI-CAGE-AT-0009]|nr:acyl transferase/acyl hydrolase/lysophospholipase [Chaetomium sp. MPI-CAGE-AT-0009]
MFSDVVCYVTRNQKTWADSALKLLEWSNAGAESSINKSVLPALIIILNAPSLEEETWLGDGTEPTDAFFNAIDAEISASSKFATIARTGDGETMTMKQLFARSFSSVYVHYIPLYGYKKLGTAQRILKQRDFLIERIESDASRVQNERDASWIRLHSRQMGHVFQLAFEHLASQSANPFDYEKCRYIVSVPVRTEQHFAQFLSRTLDSVTKERLESVAAVLATSIIRNAIPDNEKGLLLLKPDNVFRQEIRDTCSKAIDLFIQNGAKCVYYDTTKGCCVNTRSGHKIGHQNASGVLMKNGDFVGPTFDQESFMATIRQKVEDALYTTLHNDETDARHKDLRRLAAKEHGKNLKVLRDSFTKAQLEKSDPFTNSGANVCFGCLFGRPEYKLPCGHRICSNCIADFNHVGSESEHASINQASTNGAPFTNGEGHPTKKMGNSWLLNVVGRPKDVKPDANLESERTAEKDYPGHVRHHECILCGASSASSEGYPVDTKVLPDFAGLRILSIDGGGVRGIIELVILERLETLIGLGLPLNHFFDLIVGTSSGGIIALGLGQQSRRVAECIELFRLICSEGLQKRSLAMIGPFLRAVGVQKSVYRTEDLERAFWKAFSNNKCQRLGGIDMETPCRVAVTTTADRGEACLLANYEKGSDRGLYLQNDIQLWKAARCTSAAPMYFEPFSHAARICRDGGLKENNPTQVALNEARKIPNCSTRPLDLILSIGSGFADNPASAPNNNSLGIRLIPEWLSNLFATLISTMNGEEAWQKFHDNHKGHIQERASRLNVKIAGPEEPSFDDITKIAKMETEARQYKFTGSVPNTPTSPILGPAPSCMIQCAADRLRASLFFFELDNVTQHDRVSHVEGHIFCRLRPGEKGFRELLEQSRHFVVHGRKEVVVVPPLVRDGTVPMQIKVKFQEQRLSKNIRIDVNFGGEHSVAISGFPVELSTFLTYWQDRGGFLEVTPLEREKGL